MRLHVTYAGGTIGMIDSPEGLRPGADLQGWFSSQLDGIEVASNISMSVLDPLIDSSEATPEDWQTIIDDITATLCAGLHIPDKSPDNDAWIAATALRHHFTLVTRNIKDFEKMGVKLLNPFIEN